MTAPSDSSYREIQLTQGQIALVDAVDYGWLSRYEWCAFWTGRAFYALRRGRLSDGPNRGKSILMHRQILGLDFGDKRDGEHKEPSQTLDNRRANLRIATRSQNLMNARIKRTNTTGFKGVSKCRDREGYAAYITLSGKSVRLGTRSTPEEASELYRVAAEARDGEFARLS
jgi:hypothetical protein